jgi:hypothetical protein
VGDVVDGNIGGRGHEYLAQAGVHGEARNGQQGRLTKTRRLYIVLLVIGIRI